MPEEEDEEQEKARISAALSAISSAFAGVVLGEARRCLYQAEAADNYASAPRTAHHAGAWQAVTRADLRACGWAIPHLDAWGIRYYLPAIFCHHLRHRRGDQGAEEVGVILDGVLFLLLPRSHSTYDRREYAMERLALLSPAQVLAVSEFIALVESDPDSLTAWAQVRQHVQSGAPGDWRSVWWPTPSIKKQL